jgi:hypothetical protein
MSVEGHFVGFVLDLPVNGHQGPLIGDRFVRLNSASQPIPTAPIIYVAREDSLNGQAKPCPDRQWALFRILIFPDVCFCSALPRINKSW